MSRKPDGAEHRRFEAETLPQTRGGEECVLAGGAAGEHYGHLVSQVRHLGPVGSEQADAIVSP